MVFPFFCPSVFVMLVLTEIAGSLVAGSANVYKTCRRFAPAGTKIELLIHLNCRDRELSKEREWHSIILCNLSTALSKVKAIE
ncbi:hypothetical protein DFH06DRAFT_723699 [Mycena polygramma]|nr:hypothetical protein DFH06DRAFT_723699 [Mycena polygramma]